MCNNDKNLNFVDKIIKRELKEGKCNEIHTRFPPEPNGYLHIGSAYAINISYSLAKKYNGEFNLRFDDTNPKKESIEFVNAIIEDMKWLGFDYKENLFFGSDYNEKIYDYAMKLIKKGKAYVCDLNAKEIKEFRGTLTTKGKNSPYRDRSIEENIELFLKMREGCFEEGSKVLRSKIDMESSNINMRDPVIYRIMHKSHYRTKDSWCIYPMYDFAHPIQDYIEKISHSLCSSEFKEHRPLYEWVLNELELKNTLPKQIEFGRMSLSGVVTSKRYLKQLVESEVVDGWDDPRLPTIKGLRRRGYTRESILDFLGEIGVSKHESIVDVSMLEQSLRKDLKDKAKPVMSVIDPIKVTITNLEENHIEYLDFGNDIEKRKIVFSKVLYIEREDFSENPPKKYNRLTLGGEVKLKNAYFIKCEEVIKDNLGNIIELKCSYDKETKSGTGFTGRKVKGTIHWLSEHSCTPCEVRLFDSLFSEFPSSNNLFEVLNKDSIEVKKNALVESYINDINEDERVQFIRHGYFIRDYKLSNKEKIVFNQIVALKSSYNK